MCLVLTYYVCTEGSKGMGPTHVEVSRVKPLEETNVIETLRLEGGKKEEEERVGQDFMMREQQISTHGGEANKNKMKRKD